MSFGRHYSTTFSIKTRPALSMGHLLKHIWTVWDILPTSISDHIELELQITNDNRGPASETAVAPPPLAAISSMMSKLVVYIQASQANLHVHHVSRNNTQKLTRTCIPERVQKSRELIRHLRNDIHDRRIQSEPSVQRVPHRYFGFRRRCA